jgi:hypothetical protein
MLCLPLRKGRKYTARSVAALFLCYFRPLERFIHASVPFGIPQACDAIYRQARAINRIGPNGRSAMRDAFEKIGSYQGLIKHYQPPFTRDLHEAPGPGASLIARYRPHGVLVPIRK